MGEGDTEGAMLDGRQARERKGRYEMRRRSCEKLKKVKERDGEACERWERAKVAFLAGTWDGMNDSETENKIGWERTAER